jgi:hypothetical protein
MEKRRCAACGEAFRPCPRVRDQEYCGKDECRRERRRRWQAAKRQKDAAYRANQADAQRAWAAENSGYWQTYRSGHPQYVEENRMQTKQRKRDRRQRAAGTSGFAKMDSISTFFSLASGTYLLVPHGEEKLAKMDSIFVEITVVSKR